MKISRFQTPSCINAMMLQLLVARVGESNIRTVREVEKMRRVTGVESREKVKAVGEAIGEIS